MVFPGLRSCGVQRFFRRPNVIRAQEATSKGEGGGGGGREFGVLSKAHRISWETQFVIFLTRGIVSLLFFNLG